jgi:hypothetical protein
MYAVEMLVTDTICYEVVSKTAKTITVRRMKQGEVVSTTGGHCPVVHREAVSNPFGETKTVRLRKDGTYRMGNGYNALRLQQEAPTFRTDYAF